MAPHHAYKSIPYLTQCVKTEEKDVKIRKKLLGKKKCLSKRKNRIECNGGVVDQNTLYTYVELSGNKIKMTF